LQSISNNKNKHKFKILKSQSKYSLNIANEWLIIASEWLIIQQQYVRLLDHQASSEQASYRILKHTWHGFCTIVTNTLVKQHDIGNIK
jgi:hypothetical protein